MRSVICSKRSHSDVFFDMTITAFARNVVFSMVDYPSIRGGTCCPSVTRLYMVVCFGSYICSG